MGHCRKSRVLRPSCPKRLQTTRFRPRGRETGRIFRRFCSTCASSCSSRASSTCSSRASASAPSRCSSGSAARSPSRPARPAAASRPATPAIRPRPAGWPSALPRRLRCHRGADRGAVRVRASTWSATPTRACSPTTPSAPRWPPRWASAPSTSRRSSCASSATPASGDATPARARRRSPTTTSATCCGASVRREPPLSLLDGVEGCRIVETERADLCCGFGGTFAIKLPDVSVAMADEKLDRARAAGRRGDRLHRRGLPDAPGGSRAPARAGPARAPPRRPARARGPPVTPRVIHAPSTEPTRRSRPTCTVAAGNWAAQRERGRATHATGRPCASARRAIRDDAIANLPELIDALRGPRDRGRRPRPPRGAPAAEACAQVVAICRERGATSAVKSKSMLTEEIGLSEALDAAGIDAVETDLGEYIVQLRSAIARRTCSRPAVHLRRAAGRRAVRARVGPAVRPRRHARRSSPTRAARCASASCAADVGITGVNFAVAETGTLVLVESEGNIRLCTGLPRVHIAVMGIEKVVRDWAGAAHLMQLLPLAAHGGRRCRPRCRSSRARPATATTGPRSSTSCCSTTAAPRCAAPSTRAPCTASAAAPACTPARSTGRSAGTPTAAPTAGRSAPCSPPRWRTGPRAATSCRGCPRCAGPVRRPAR